jgi:hypothetical protein
VEREKNKEAGYKRVKHQVTKKKYKKGQANKEIKNKATPRGRK